MRIKEGDIVSLKEGFAQRVDPEYKLRAWSAILDMAPRSQAQVMGVKQFPDRALHLKLLKPARGSGGILYRAGYTFTSMADA